MKKLIIALMVALAPNYIINAQSTGLFGGANTTEKVADNQHRGEFPVVAGKVTFSKTIALPGKSKSDLYKVAANWASLRDMASKENGKWTNTDYFCNLELAGVKTFDPNSAQLVCFGDEELVFSNKFLAKDYTRANYDLTVDIRDGKITVTMTNIQYVYTRTSVPERIMAEDWITDEASFTKRGRLMKENQKFRNKTLFLFNELCNELQTMAK